MGNSNGTLAEYWDAIESNDGLQGGFIWEWWDHGLVQGLSDGSTRWAYGGDFGDQPNDGNFCLDGLNWPDRNPKPAMWEHRQLAAPVRVAAGPDVLTTGVVEVSNHQYFTGLGWLRASWQLTADGEVLAGGELPLPEVGPGESASAALPGWTAPAATAAGRELMVTVRFRTAAAQSWAPEGFEVCWAQLPLDAGSAKPASQSVRPALSGKVELDADGLLVHELIAAAPRLNLWRAPTDNDRMAGLTANWREWGIDRLTRKVTGIRRESHEIVVTADVQTASGIAIVHEQRFAEQDGGGVLVRETVRIPDALPDLARVGVVLETVPGLEHVTWFGRGPIETYPDRRRGAALGLWGSTVAELYVPYVRPQENGGRADVRWLELSDGNGRGLRIGFDRPRQVSATHFRASDLAAAKHDVELTPRPETIVCLDAAHRGLGTASCGPDTLPEYLVRPGVYEWSWTIAPLG
jgi:beta-galactosidase